MLNLTEALSDVSRTNQLKIMLTPEDVAEKLFQYLFNAGKGIEAFNVKNLDLNKYDDPSLKFYQKQHRAIKHEIKKRLAEYGEEWKTQDIQYFLARSGEENIAFFLSPSKNHSGWKRLFCEKWKNNRERIFNLAFKFYILAQDLPIETINGFEELLILDSASVNANKSKDALFVWGQNILVRYNYHNVLTLKLSRKSRLFLPKDDYSVLDGEDLGALLVYKNKKYYFDRDYDGRRKNFSYFMRFDSDNESLDKFKKTQLYYYQSLMTQLERFLEKCDISYTQSHFQADHYLENPFIKNIETIEALEIINNVGVDLTEIDRVLLRQFLKHQGVNKVTFFNTGKSISAYEQKMGEDENETYWEITEAFKWSKVMLDKGKNYLIFNKLLDEESGSMAYQQEDGLWCPSDKIHDKQKIDFYSQLKKRYNYLNTGEFFSTQGINVSEFKAVGDEKSSWSVLNYAETKIDAEALQFDTKAFTDGRLLDPSDSILAYLVGQNDSELWHEFIGKYKIKISPEMQKVLIELGIKSWIRESFVNPISGLLITPQLFSEKQFFAIYVRHPRGEEAKAVAVEFLYKDNCVYIKNVIRDMQAIKQRFRFLRTRSNSEELKDDQQYFVDEVEQSYISCYTDDYFTPTLIGRNGILEDMNNGRLKIDRQTQDKNSSRLLPLVSYFNGDIKPVNRIQNMICFDLKNQTFIQYYIPPGTGLPRLIKRGFRAYHLIGYKYSKEQIPTAELIKHPITALHFNTLTQNVLRISDNSQTSLLQKVAKVLVEN